MKALALALLVVAASAVGAFAQAPPAPPSCLTRTFSPMCETGFSPYTGEGKTFRGANTLFNGVVGPGLFSLNYSGKQVCSFFKVMALAAVQTQGQANPSAGVGMGLSCGGILADIDYQFTSSRLARDSWSWNLGIDPVSLLASAYKAYSGP